MPTLTGTTTIPYENGRKMIFSCSGGDMTIKRAKTDSSYVECDGSPVADGTEVAILTNSTTGALEITAGTGGMDYQYSYEKLPD